MLFSTDISASTSISASAEPSKLALHSTMAEYMVLQADSKPTITFLSTPMAASVLTHRLNTACGFTGDKWHANKSMHIMANCLLDLNRLDPSMIDLYKLLLLLLL